MYKVMFESMKSTYTSVCNPAKFYLVLSIFAFIIGFLQNIGNDRVYCLGSLGCSPSNSIYIYVFQIIYIAFWTWVLNIICKGGAPVFSWILVLIPFVLYFILIALSLFS
jgi:hypothetical protein